MADRAARVAALAVSVVVATLLVPSSTETAVANGDTRTLHLYHTHTGESIDATFRVDGHYDPAVLRQLNHFLRDWRNDDQTNMDPRLFDTLWEVYRTAGATQPIQIYSAYRSPETNAMLRRRSRAVAEHSQHMLGKAMDTTIPGFPMHLIREVGMKLQRGGVGWYPSANFVHLDVGGVRSWPRMSYEQLSTLFPDGKTVHIAANGQTLPGYEAARQEIAARGDIEVPPAQESGGFFAWLFGGFGGNDAKEDTEDRRTTAVAAAQPAPQPVPVVQAAMPVAQAARPAPEPETILAYAGPDTGRVAALATATPIPSAVALPLPPRRPAEFAALAEPEVPLPPVRPLALVRVETREDEARTDDRQTDDRQTDDRQADDRRLVTHQADTHPDGTRVAASAAPRTGLDAIGVLITKTSSGVPALRRSRLPAIVTQTPRGPGQALAFAAPDVVARDEVPDLRRAAAKPAVQRLGLRSGLRLASAEPAMTPFVTAPHFTGLRKATHDLATHDLAAAGVAAPL